MINHPGGVRASVAADQPTCADELSVQPFADAAFVVRMSLQVQKMLSMR
jgi:2',3'-cyclic-nucleotide 2'-phosphodiesterase (5'-nucleotidase family)